MDLVIKPAALQGVGPTFDLWKSFPVTEVFGTKDRSVGFGFEDDFESFGVTGGPKGWLLSTGTGCSVAQVDGLGGVVKLLLDGNAADDQAVMQAGNSAGGLFLMAGSAPKELVFEARAKVSTVTASVMNVFLGLAEAGSATTVLPITAGDALGDKNMIGFHRLAATTTALSFGYKADGQAAVNKGTVGTLAADTWFKVGFRYDERTGTITPWFNGLEVPSLRITKAAWALATAPCDAYLHAIAGVLAGTSAAAANLQIDWIRVGQLA